jgi:hypothetical protein
MGGIIQVDTIQNNNTSTLISQTNATTIIIGSTTNTVEISGNSGLVVPKGNTSQRQAVTGSFRFNTQTGYFEGYNGSSYTVIAPYPLITSISPTTINQASLSTQNVTIVGTSFENGATVAFIGNDATVYSSPTVTFNSSSSLTARINSSVTNANEPYVVKVTNPSSLYTESSQTISINASPEFTTPSGSLGTLADNARAGTNITSVVATDPEGQAITYTIYSGTIPSGITFNSDGTWGGTAAQVATQTTYNFVVQASDGSNSNTRSFSITVQAPVNMVATGGTITSYNDGTYNWKSHTFDSSDTFAITTAGTVVSSIEYLIVAGGGGGGGNRSRVGCGGGGGAGGMLTGSFTSFTTTSYAVTIGGGGGGGGNTGVGGTGSNSSIFSITANGGGGGGSGQDSGGNSGGSGGGGGYQRGGGSGTSGQGNSGDSGQGGGAPYYGGGGGGKGGSGSGATGGNGENNSYNNTTVLYSKGGGGGQEQGNRGADGGGANSGGGGGAGAGPDPQSGNSGLSGRVIVRYQVYV